MEWINSTFESKPFSKWTLFVHSEPVLFHSKLAIRCRKTLCLYLTLSFLITLWSMGCDVKVILREKKATLTRSKLRCTCEICSSLLNLGSPYDNFQLIIMNKHKYKTTTVNWYRINRYISRNGNICVISYISELSVCSLSITALNVI